MAHLSGLMLIDCPASALNKLRDNNSRWWEPRRGDTTIGAPSSMLKRGRAFSLTCQRRRFGTGCGSLFAMCLVGRPRRRRCSLQGTGLCRSANGQEAHPRSSRRRGRQAPRSRRAQRRCARDRWRTGLSSLAPIRS